MHARQALFASKLFGEDIQKIIPVIDTDGSDSSIFCLVQIKDAAEFGDMVTHRYTASRACTSRTRTCETIHESLRGIRCCRWSLRRTTAAWSG